MLRIIIKLNTPVNSNKMSEPVTIDLTDPSTLEYYSNFASSVIELNDTSSKFYPIEIIHGSFFFDIGILF